MFVPCSGTLDLATLSGLKQPHTPLILATLFLHVVIQVRFPLKLLLRNGKIFRTYMSLEPDAGQRFPLDLEDLNSIHGVLNAVSSDMLLGEGTTKFRTLLPIKFLCHGTLYLKKVSLIGHQQVRGRTYQSLKQTQERIHLLIKELTHQSLTLTPPIKKLSIMPLIHQSLMLTPPIKKLSILITSIKLPITTLSIQTLPLSPWNDDDQLALLNRRKVDCNPRNTGNVRLLEGTKARTGRT